ncbi:Uncharacterized protein family UPF0066 domain protein [Candidatus Magnetoovum chiemensis]|nr:Uncharacterized protein family UPF0066 domain protein [Candidatus Magnetoovum chiemensis]
MSEIIYKPIGIIHSPFNGSTMAPIQPKAAIEIEGTVEVFSEYVSGLKDVEGFSHVILLYHFHLVKGVNLEVKPFLDEEFHGVFATRAPARPNSIGISVVCLQRVDGGILHVSGVDVIDGTPLLDIKPYVPEFDIYEVDRTGWLEKSVWKLLGARDDCRFIK